MHTEGSMRRNDTSPQDKNHLPGTDTVCQQEQSTHISRGAWGSKEKHWWKQHIAMCRTDRPSAWLRTMCLHQCAKCRVACDKRTYIVCAVLSATLSHSGIRESLSRRSRISHTRTRANVAEGTWKESFWCANLGQDSKTRMVPPTLRLCYRKTISHRYAHWPTWST